MTTDPTKIRTITLTDRAPVRITDVDWPIVAEKTWDNAEVERLPSRTMWIKVRKNSDGRHIVYGGYDTQWDNEHNVRGGEVVPAIDTSGDGGAAGAITRVCITIGAQQHSDIRRRLAQQCIAALPAELLL